MDLFCQRLKYYNYLFNGSEFVDNSSDYYNVELHKTKIRIKPSRRGPWFEVRRYTHTSYQISSGEMPSTIPSLVKLAEQLSDANFESDLKRVMLVLGEKLDQLYDSEFEAFEIYKPSSVKRAILHNVIM